MSLPAGTLLQSRYRILRKLGQGGMGAVYEAFDLHVSAIVALKETSNSENISLQAFRKEAKLLANLHHESLPHVMDCFHENGGWFFVMEYVEGDDIEKSLEERRTSFPLEDVLDWADQILDALEYLHENGIIHLDIKPSNLKLTNRRKIKLLDFGISKGAVGEITTLQNSYGVYGATRRYAPLEQLLMVYPDSRHMLEVNFSDRIETFCKTVDLRTDLFALAMTLYQLLSRRCPETADLRAMSIWSGKGDNLKPVSDFCPQFPRAIEAVLQRALALEKKDRFASASEMRAQLGAARRIYERAKAARAAKILPVPVQSLSPVRENAPPRQAAVFETKIGKDFLESDKKQNPPGNSKADTQQILERQDRLRAEQRELIERNEKTRRRTLTFISVATIFIFGLLVGVVATIPGSTANLANEPANVNKNPAASFTETPKNVNKPKKKEAPAMTASFLQLLDNIIFAFGSGVNFFQFAFDVAAEKNFVRKEESVDHDFALKGKQQRVDSQWQSIFGKIPVQRIGQPANRINFIFIADENGIIFQIAFDKKIASDKFFPL